MSSKEDIKIFCCLNAGMVQMGTENSTSYKISQVTLHGYKISNEIVLIA